MATARTSPRFLSGVIFRNGTDSNGRSGTSICANAGIASRDSNTNMQNCFMAPPKCCELHFISEICGAGRLKAEISILNRRMPRSNLFPQESKHAETDLDFLSLKDSRTFLQGVTTRYRPKEAPAERVWAAEDLVGRAHLSCRHRRKQNQKVRKES